MARNALELDMLLADVPRDQRIASLVVSLIGRRPENIRTCCSLLSLFGALASLMEINPVERMVIAEELRNLADEIEHARERVCV